MKNSILRLNCRGLLIVFIHARTQNPSIHPLEPSQFSQNRHAGRRRGGVWRADFAARAEPEQQIEHRRHRRAAARAQSDTDCCSSENIVALCDVDTATLREAARRNIRQAKFYQDFRVMFDEMGKSIDAVDVATPDHFHAIAESHAMRMGKHVYGQKPLAQTVYEARYLRNLAQGNRRRHADGQSRQRGGRLAPRRRMHPGRDHRPGGRSPHLDEPPDLAAGHGPPDRFRPGARYFELGHLDRSGADAALRAESL